MASFYCSEYLKESLESGDIREIRNALLAYVDVDPAFKDHVFQDAIDYVTKRHFDVYEPHDPGLFAEEGIPDKDRFYQIQTGLRHNFSRERVKQLIDTGRRCMADASIYRMTGTPAYTPPRQTQPSRPGPAAGKEAFSPKSDGQDERTTPRSLKAALAAVLAVVIIVLIILLIYNHRKL